MEVLSLVPGSVLFPFQVGLRKMRKEENFVKKFCVTLDHDEITECSTDGEASVVDVTLVVIILHHCLISG
jgi:hypothetical protein